MADEREIPFEIGGAGYRLRFNFNALCRAEEVLNLTVPQIAEQLNSAPSFNLIRAVFHVGVVEEIDVEHAGEMINRLGIPRSIELITEAFAKSPMMMPAPSKRPRKSAAAE